MRNLMITITLIAFITINAICGNQDVLEKYNCTIIKTETLKTIKKGFYIRVQEQLTEDQLREVAQQIKKDNNSYERLFIFYLLPDMEMGSGAWAISHFNPNLEIVIMGATKEQEEQLKNEITDSEDIIGKWFCGYAGLEHSIIFEKKEDKIIAKLKFKDRSSMEEILIKKPNGRFDIKGNENGEYYILNSSGDLELWDTQGKFTTAKKIE